MKGAFGGEESSRMKPIEGEHKKQDSDESKLLESCLKVVPSSQLFSFLSQYFSFFVVCVLKGLNTIFQQETLIIVFDTGSSLFLAFKDKNDFQIFPRLPVSNR